MALFTLEEKFVIAAYRIAKQMPDPDEGIDPVTIGNTLNLHPNKARTIAKALVRGNFFRKKSEDLITITDRTTELAEKLLGL